jgi:hypothetical protein
MDPATTDLVKFLAALIVPALVGLGTLALSNRHGRRQAETDREHQALLAREAAARATIADRYDERRQAYSGLVNVAVHLRDEAAEREYEGKEPPENFLDGPELEDHFRSLTEAVNNVLLIGTSQTRIAAEELATRVQSYVWSQDGYRDLDAALILFRAAARADLGIEQDGEDAPSDLPPNPRGTEEPRSGER